MKDERSHSEIVELGAVSEATQGFGFDVVEPVGYMPKTGIRDD